DTWMWVVIIAAAVVLVVILITVALARRRRAGLKARFGPEYDRTLEALDSRRRTVSDLQEREALHARLNLQPLTPSARDRYRIRWAEMQSQFVDRPQVTVADADSMITQVM